ncbi:hypothetical protein LTR28_007253 [Elasticomyces elasticus]|nr:hypothetical protein LTR28_007253 [Elasticomyces elasticus]
MPPLPRSLYWLQDAKVANLTGNNGAEVQGLRLSKLSANGKGFADISIQEHLDVTFEEQTLGTTFIYLLEGPSAGGDTLFSDQVETYRRLSPGFQKPLHGLEAVHGGHEQAANSSARNGIFTRRIVGFEKEESDCLLEFLYHHMALEADFQARVQWEKGTVIVWDNRVVRITAHAAILYWTDVQRMDLARITPQAERPVETAFEG